MDEGTIRQIDAVLAAFDGVETDISSAGRENTRSVNRIARVATLKRISGETTFRRTVTRYVVSGTERELMIGAERVGGGTWRLIARWADERAPS